MNRPTTDKPKAYAAFWLPKVARVELAFGRPCYAFDPDIGLRDCGAKEVPGWLVEPLDALIIKAHPEWADDKKVVKERKARKEKAEAAAMELARAEKDLRAATERYYADAMAGNGWAGKETFDNLCERRALEVRVESLRAFVYSDGLEGKFDGR